MELSAPYLAACGLLAVAGVVKALRPGDTARALVAGLARGTSRSLERRTEHLVRAGSLLEAALGVAGLCVLSPAVCGAVAASYAGFCGFVLLARRRGGPLSTCGCFGALDTPPTRLHLFVDAGLALSAIWVAADGSHGWTVRWLAHQPWHGAPLVLLSATLAWLAGLCLSDAARLVAARRLFAGPSPGTESAR